MRGHSHRRWSLIRNRSTIWGLQMRSIYFVSKKINAVIRAQKKNLLKQKKHN